MAADALKVEVMTTTALIAAAESTFLSILVSIGPLPGVQTPLRGLRFRGETKIIAKFGPDDERRGRRPVTHRSAQGRLLVRMGERRCRIVLRQGPASSDSLLERGEQFGQPFDQLYETFGGEFDRRRQHARFDAATGVPPHDIGRIN